jgi:hypothetical protein
LSLMWYITGFCSDLFFLHWFISKTRIKTKQILIQIILQGLLSLYYECNVYFD